MSLSNIVIELTLDDGDVHSKIVGTEKQLRKFQKSLGSTERKIKSVERSHFSWAQAMRDGVIVLGLSRHALLNLDAAFLSIPRSVIAATGELERMNQLMRGLSESTKGYTEIVKEANSGTQFVFDLSKNSPFEVNSVTDAFVKLRSVGIDPTNGSLNALVDSVAKFGGTKENLKRAAIAIQQMAGKGVISMEEMRQQLAESVPDAMKLMSRGVGLSMAELTKQISSGSVSAKEALQALFRQMAIENTGAAAEMSKTWVGLTSRFETQMVLFKNRIGRAGYFDEVKNQLSFIVNDLLNSPEALNAADKLGNALASVVRGATEAVRFLAQYAEQIVTLAEVTFAYVAARSVLSKSYDVFVVKQNLSLASYARETAALAEKIKMTNLAAAANARFAASTKAVTFSEQTAAIWTNIGAFMNLRSALTGLRFVFAGVGTAIATLGRGLLELVGGPIGAIATGIAFAIPLFQEWKSATDETLESLNKIRSTDKDIFTRENLNTLKDSVDQYKKNLERIQKLNAEHIRRTKMGQLFQWFDTTGGDIKELSDANAKIEEFFKKLGVDINGGLARLEKQVNESELAQKIRKQARDIESTVTGDLTKAINKYKLEVADITESGASKEDKVAQKQAADERLKAEIDNYFKPKIREAKASLDRLRKMNKDEASDEIRTALAKYEALKQLEEKKLSAFDLQKGGVSESRQKKQASELKAYNTLMEKVQIKQAGLAAKINKVSSAVAKFNQELALGKWSTLTEKQKRDYRELLLLVDKLNKKIKDDKQKKIDDDKANQARKIAKQRFDNLGKQLKSIYNDIDNNFAKKTNNNPYLKATIGADQYNRRLDLLAEKLKAAAKENKELETELNGKLNEIDAKKLDAYAKATEKTIFSLGKMTDEINTSLLPANKQVEAAYQKNILDLEKWRTGLDTPLSTEQSDIYFKHIAALNKQLAEQTKTPIQKLADEWKRTNEAFDQIWADTMTNFVDTLANGLVEGKFAFEDFFKSLAKMIIKAQLQAAAANIIGSILGAPTQTATPAKPQLSSTGLFNADIPMLPHANGGIMTANGSLALRKYAKGGIAKNAQLALFGEGSTPEAYVPLPDGRTIPVTIKNQIQPTGKEGANVQFNLINQSDAQLEAKQSGNSRFDGEKMVLDVVLKNIKRAGDFRNEMRTAIR